MFSRLLLLASARAVKDFWCNKNVVQLVSNVSGVKAVGVNVASKRALWWIFRCKRFVGVEGF